MKVHISSIMDGYLMAHLKGDAENNYCYNIGSSQLAVF